MNARKTELLAPDVAGRTRAVEIWRAGGLVAFPTETVYGLGADATNEHAVARIFQAKGRPSFNPLIIHVADLATARRYAIFNDEAAQLAEAFWPGPLSLVLPVRADSGLSKRVTAGLNTVAVRIPDARAAAHLLHSFSGAIAAPSANLSGRISPTTAEHVLADLSGAIDAVVDDGPCGVGLESTIIDPAAPVPTLLRPGGLPVEAIQAAIGHLISSDTTPLAPKSPGQMLSHYAPRHEVVLNISKPSDNALFLGFGPGFERAAANLSRTGDLHEAAANLFGHLHLLDRLATEQGKSKIEVAIIPDHGLGRAINDRLKRAAQHG